MTFEIYGTDSVIVIFLGTMGNRGLLIHRGAERWEYHLPLSIAWDSFHQQVYRNFRADAMTVEEMEREGIPLPDLAEYDMPVQKMMWEDNFKSEAPFSAVPRELLPDLRRHAGEETDAYLVLLEDRYETAFGDGRFLYPIAAFWSRDSAECHARGVVHNERDPAKREFYEYSIKRVLLSADESRGTVRAKLDIGSYEHYSIDDVLRLLAASPSPGR